MSSQNTYRIVPLGDAAVIVDFGNCIDEAVNKKVISLFHFLNKKPLYGMIEVVPAYSSLVVYYNVLAVKENNHMEPAFDVVKNKLEEILQQAFEESDNNTRLIKIPVYYNGDDLEFISKEKNISIEDIIQIHSATIYNVYMLGFLPGFPYMGKVDERIAMPRRQQPRLKVKAGSVGIAGIQTGIYSLESPGGWQIIGHTPLKLFKTSPEPSPKERAFEESQCLLQPGDKVKFYSISNNEFENY